MDAIHYRIRDFDGQEYDALARVRSRVSPDRPTTGEEMRHGAAAFSAPHLTNLVYVVEETTSAAVVAWASLEQLPFNYHPRKYWTTVLVDPDHRHRGIGPSLFRRVEAEARSRGAETLWADVRASSAEGLRFFERHGFSELRRFRRSQLDLESVDRTAWSDPTARLADDGIRCTTLAAEGPDRPEVRARYYRLHQIAGRDIPIVGSPTPLSYEQFVRLEFDRPGFLPEGTFLAARGEEYVAVTVLERRARRPDLIHVGFTGTHPDFRGRGLATELKRRSIAYARMAGYRWMDTGNDYQNPRIWAINERLGFRTLETVIFGEKTLAPSE